MVCYRQSWSQDKNLWHQEVNFRVQLLWRSWTNHFIHSHKYLQNVLKHSFERQLQLNDPSLNSLIGVWLQNDMISNLNFWIWKIYLNQWAALAKRFQTSGLIIWFFWLRIWRSHQPVLIISYLWMILRYFEGIFPEFFNQLFFMKKNSKAFAAS